MPPPLEPFVNTRERGDAVKWWPAQFAPRVRRTSCSRNENLMALTVVANHSVIKILKVFRYMKAELSHLLSLHSDVLGRYFFFQ